MDNPDPILVINDVGSQNRIDLLGFRSGIELRDPYWKPKVPQFKGGGAYVDSTLSDGKRLTHYVYDNVIEEIPITISAKDQDKAIDTLRKVFKLGIKSANYWTRIFEHDNIWLECQPACNNCLKGYSKIIKISISELPNIFGQPFFSSAPHSTFDELTLFIERVFYWTVTEPGQVIGPLYNFILNPDFEFWNFGIEDTEPDNWTDFETLWITGKNSKEATDFNSGSGCLKVNVSGSTQAGAAKGLTQVINGLKDTTEYTVVAWVRNDGVSNGVGRILVNYSSQLELYRSGDKHGWIRYVGKITTDIADTVSIDLQILTTAANTDGTVYFDSLMFLEGDFVSDVSLNIVPHISSSKIINKLNRSDATIKGERNINYIDAWNVPGDVDALVRVEVENDTEPSDYSAPVEFISKIRVGMRRTKDVLEFDNMADPKGFAVSDVCSGDYIETGIFSGWIETISKSISGRLAVDNNQGRYRVFVRLKDTKTSGSLDLNARAFYYLGYKDINNKTIDKVPILVLDEWTLVDVTQFGTVNFDLKFTQELINNIGYIIQLERESSNDEVYLDYSMMMPTDGGFIEVDLNPPVGYKNAIIVDNTQDKNLVSGTVKRNGWIQIFQTALTNMRDFIEFKGSIYAIGGSGPLSAVIKFDGKTWSNSFLIPTAYNTNDFRALEIYNNRLYLSLGSGFSPSYLFSSVDGSNFSLEVSFASIAGGDDLYAFDNYLFYAASDEEAIWRWDGTTMVKNFLDGAGRMVAFAEFKGNLYCLSSNSHIYLYDKDNDNWTDQITIPYTLSKDMIAFKGYLYVIIDSVPDRIVRWDGISASIELIDDDSLLNDPTKIEVYNDKLYISGTNVSIIVSEDGENWEKTYDPNEYAITALKSISGILFAGAQGFNPAIYAFADEDILYNVPNWKGKLFKSPPETRHRFVFSYDREDYINNSDDQVLVGLGFVPRFLSLIGQE